MYSRLVPPAAFVTFVFGLILSAPDSLSAQNPFSSNQPGYPNWSPFVDTRGVEPDLVVVRPPEYYLVNSPDVVLQKALTLLKAPQ